MASFDRSFVDDLIQRTDVADIIGERVPLKKKGKTLSACCPFHDEKTPSFNVDPIKQFYHCFGCGVGGDCIRFLMEFDRMSFAEAIEYLAKRIGVEIPKNQVAYQPKQNPDVLSVMDMATNYYQQLLAITPEAQEYIKQREINAKIIEQFAIGFAPKGWDNIIKHILQSNNQNNGLEWLEKGGLIIRKDNNTGFYDRFRNRLMFPIRNIKGKVIGFGGRVIDKNDNPKYLNSPETDLFHKSHELYGLYEAASQRQSLDTIVVVEGYMDVVALAQYGIHNAVATLGTAIGKSHLQKLFKYCSKVVFCFDGDEAGHRAANKAMEISLPEMIDGREVSFLLLQDGEDPDSIVRSKGTEFFHDKIANAKVLSNYLIDTAKQGLNLDTAEGKASFVRSAMAFIQQLPKALIQKLLIQKVAEITGLADHEIKSLLQITPKRKLNQPQTRAPASNHFDELQPPPIDDEFAFDEIDEPVNDTEQPINHSLLIVSNQLLRYLLINPQLAQSREVDWSILLTQENGQLLKYVKEAIESSYQADADISSIIAYLSGKYQHIVNDFMTIYQNLEKQFGLKIEKDQAEQEFIALYNNDIIKKQHRNRIIWEIEGLKEIPISEMTLEQKQTQIALYRQLAELKES